METRSNGLTYTLAGDIVGGRVNTRGAYGRFDRTHAYQRPGKSVTPYMVTLTDGRERRVYAMAYGNGTVPYVIVRGADVILDDVTMGTLARMAAAGETWSAAREYIRGGGSPRTIDASRDDVDGEWTGERARAVAADYQSSGTIGSVLAQFASTGKAPLTAFLDDIAATRTQFGSMLTSGIGSELDMLATYALNNAR